MTLQATEAARRLLVVEDELVDRMLAARAVAPLGFSVDAAGSVEEALGLLRRHAYHAVVLDLALGNNEGISLLPALQAAATDPLLIFVSGMDDRVRAASARLAGTLGLRVAGALAKPVAPARLRALLCSSPDRLPPVGRLDAVCPGAPELAEALSQGRIQAAFQPKVTLRSGAVGSLEALARWHCSDGTILMPDIFIPLAEASRLIVPLTEQILRQSLAACRGWQTRFPACGVAVNISPLALANPALPDQIEAMLNDAALPPSALTAEITESMIIADPVLATEVVTRLRIKGIGLSIDDFGTGHASLLSLMRLPFTELKIDRSFVAACETDLEAWKIIRATVSLGHELGMSVVAEGIETASVACRLNDVGCDCGQGWFFGRPMTTEGLQAWLARGAAASTWPAIASAAAAPQSAD